ncbi:MAG: hypothetical protein AAF990_21905 [Bacteroidota bacterium]
MEFYDIIIKLSDGTTAQDIKRVLLEDFSALKDFENLNPKYWMDDSRFPSFRMGALESNRPFILTLGFGDDYISLGSASPQADAILGDKLDFFVKWFYDHLKNVSYVVGLFDSPSEPEEIFEIVEKKRFDEYEENGISKVFPLHLNAG